jgi:hypothetical protein
MAQQPLLKRCPRCNGPMYRGYDEDYSCLFCGECVYPRLPALVVPPPAGIDAPRKRGRPRKNPTAA